MITPPEYLERLQHLQAQISQHALEAFLVTAQESIYYLTGVIYNERPFFLLAQR